MRYSIVGDFHALRLALSVTRGRSVRIVRILVAVKPRVYREVLALSLHQHRPDAEVLISPPESLDEEVGRFKPHLVVLGDNDGAAPDGLSGVLYRVEILLGASMDARISVDGRVAEVKDICTGDLLAVVDEAEKMISKEVADQPVLSPNRLRATPLFPPLRLCR